LREVHEKRLDLLRLVEGDDGIDDPADLSVARLEDPRDRGVVFVETGRARTPTERVDLAEHRLDGFVRRHRPGSAFSGRRRDRALLTQRRERGHAHCRIGVEVGGDFAHVRSLIGCAVAGYVVDR
jgi:hypothetical protein